MAMIPPQGPPTAAQAPAVVNWPLLRADLTAVAKGPSLANLEKLVVYVVGLFGVANPTGGLPTNIREVALGGAAVVLAAMHHKPATP